MQRESADWILTNRLDLDRLGVMGHSLGGATAVQVCLEDPRFKAAINLDGFQFGDIRRRSLNRPVLMIESESFAGANDFLAGQHAGGLQKITIAGSTHMDFTDENFTMPMLRFFGMTGPIEPASMGRILNEGIIAFFEE